MAVRVRRFLAPLIGVILVAGLLVSDPNRSRAQEAAHLTHDVAASDAPDQRLPLDTVTPFLPEGGRAVIEPGSSSEEQITYAGIDTASGELTGVTRTAPSSHLA